MTELRELLDKWRNECIDANKYIDEYEINELESMLKEWIRKDRENFIHIIEEMKGKEEERKIEERYNEQIEEIGL